MNDTDQEFKRFVRGLDTRKLIGWSEQLRLGKPLYDHLVMLVRSGSLRSNQLANALVALHRLRRVASDREVFAVFVEALASEHKRARDQAVRFVTGMLRFSPGRDVALTNAVKRALRSASSRGVTKDADALICEALEGHPRTGGKT